MIYKNKTKYPCGATPPSGAGGVAYKWACLVAHLTLYDSK